MADLNGIVIPVDTKQVVDAINKTKALEGSIVKLFNSYTQGNITQKQFSEGLRSLNKDYAALGASVPKSTAVIRGYAKELQLAKTAQDNLTAAKKRAETAFALGIQRAEEEQRAIAQSRKETEAWFAQQRRRLDMMRTSEAMALQAANGYSGFGFAVQQAGYQVGDFFVQVQSGTNLLVAFGQQATQLVYIIPAIAQELNIARITLLGMSLSVGGLTAILGILIPVVTMLGAAWMRTGQETKQAVTEVENNIKGLETYIEQIHLDNIKIGFKVDEDSIAKVREDMVKARMAIAEDAQKVASLKKIGGRATPFAEAAQAEVDAQQEIIDNGQKILDKLEAEKEARRMLNGQMSATKTLQETLVRNKQEEFAKAKAQAEEQEKFNKKVEYGKDVFHMLAGETSSVSIYMSDALKAALGLSQVNFSNITSMAAIMANMAGQMGRGQPATGAPIMKSLDDWQRSPSRTNLPFIPSSGLGTPAQTQYPGVSLKTSTGGGGGGSKPLTFDEYIKGLEKEFATKQKMIGLYGISAEIEKARADAAKALNKTVDKLNPKEIERIDALTKQSYALEQQQQLMDTVQSNMSDAFMSMIDGSKSVHKAFKDMMFNILKSIYEQKVLTPMTNALTSMLFSANGNVFNNGSVQAFASGGVVGSPTFFPMAGGKTGLMGEAGPEAIMPLKRGPDGRLGVVSSGGGSVTVNNVINVTGTGDAAYVRSEVAKMMPQITGATKAAVIDARKRGGQMAAAFR